VAQDEFLDSVCRLDVRQRVILLLGRNKVEDEELLAHVNSGLSRFHKRGRELPLPELGHIVGQKLAA
jgi:hypothetical protein